MNESEVRYAVDQGVATLTLNRPDVLNSFNRSMAFEFQDRLQQIAEDSGVRAVLLTGSGKGFCAGQDLASILPDKDGNVGDLSAIVRECYNPIIRQMQDLPKPIVCAVNGVAAGAGANLVFACDVVVAADSASFIQSFCKVGLVPDSGGTFFLPRLVGLMKAKSLALMGDKLSAGDAQALGLVYMVTPADQLREAAFGIASKLATQPTVGLGLTKLALHASADNSLDEQLELEADYQGRAGETDDYLEGLMSFVEKRKPNFKGR